MVETLAPELPVLTRKDFTSDQEVRWCPGCGDYAILAQMQKMLPKLEVPKENVVFISGIGCSSRFPYYMETYGIHSIHGRAPTLATGLKLARPELCIFVITGDGDGLSIGGNHFIHTLRRNVDINVVLFNNRIYGLTKGQFSPTSPAGHKTKSSPMGSVAQPLNPLSVALASEATFVARSIDVEIQHLQDTLLAAAKHPGASFIEVYQNCNIFNNGAWRYATDPAQKKDNVLRLEHGKPMVFGTERNKGLRLDGLRPRVVEIGKDGVTIDDILVHDATDEFLAYLLSRVNYPEFPVPIGIVRNVTKTTYERGLLEQVEQAKQAKGEGDLKTLYFSADLWTVNEEGSEKTPTRNGKSVSPLDDQMFEEMMAGWARDLTMVQHELATVPIHKLKPRKPLTCHVDDTLGTAVKTLREAGANCLLVCDDEGVLKGLFTDRDILRVSLLVKDLEAVKVSQCMLPNPSTLAPNLPIARALHFMSVQRVRYLPLADEKGVPTGLVTADEIINYISEGLKREERSS